MKATRNVLLGLVLLSAGLAQAADLNCATGTANVEEFRYSWRLRGGLGWIAGLVFPNRGVGNLRTVFPKAGEHEISSQLMMTPQDGKNGFYVYESQMDEVGSKTFMTYHGYAWGKKARKERTVFDYVKKLARIHRETTEKVEDRVKLIPPEAMPDSSLRDVLTAIYFLREHAADIKAPIVTSIYSDGKHYPVILRPAERATFVMSGKTVTGLGFEIVDAPGGKKWPGGVRVWISEDARRIPFRIEISESMASMQLDLQSVESCAFMGRFAGGAASGNTR
jgi:hypothetical protein